MSLDLTFPPQHICIIRLSAIGDICHVLPVLRTLQAVWPGTKFTWIIGKVEQSLLAGLPGVEFIVFDKSRGAGAYVDLNRALAGRRFDVLLHMHASMRANLASLLVRSDIRLGFDRARAKDYQWLFTNQEIEAKPRQHVMDGLFGFAEALGIKARVQRWDIPIADADRAFARAQVAVDRPALVISPCSSQRLRNFRNWSAANYAAVADYAAERYGAQVILTGGPTQLERQYGEEISSLSRSVAVNLIGKTSLKQLLAVLAEATVLICPDSGPAHMANAVATPVIGLYATSNRERTGPYWYQDFVVDRYPQAVAQETGKTVAEMPWGGRVRNPAAMDLIMVADVNAMLDRVLARPA